MPKTKFHIFLQRKMLRTWCYILLFSGGWLSGCHTSKVSASYTTNPANTYIIRGSVSQVFPYCGGARPTREILEQMATPMPYPGKTFYIKPGAVNNLELSVITSFTTDSNGNFSIHLPPGIYSIVLKEQLTEINAADFETKTVTVNKECLEAWWKKPYYLLEIKQHDIVLPNFVFHHRCYITNDIPCTSYHGPAAP